MADRLMALPKPRIVQAGEEFPGEWLTPPEPGVTVKPWEPLTVYVDDQETKHAGTVNLDIGEVLQFTDDRTPNGWGEQRRLIYGRAVELRRA